MAKKLLTPCRNEDKASEAGAILGQQSYLYPAGMKIKLVGQEPSQGNKLFTPCRKENKACGAGAISGQQAIHTLPN